MNADSANVQDFHTTSIFGADLLARISLPLGLHQGVHLASFVVGVFADWEYMAKRQESSVNPEDFSIVIAVLLLELSYLVMRQVPSS